MKKVSVTIRGDKLLMHKYPMEPLEAIEKQPKEVQAEEVAYRDPETNNLVIPGICVQRALIGAATYSKGKGRASLQKPAAACLSVDPEYLDLGVKEYEVDARSVVVPATKGRIIRYRPRINNWTTRFELTWDERLLKESEVRRIVDDCGLRVGLLDFRPEKKGPFGKFVVVEWKAID